AQGLAPRWSVELDVVDRDFERFASRQSNGHAEHGALVEAHGIAPTLLLDAVEWQLYLGPLVFELHVHAVAVLLTRRRGLRGRHADPHRHIAFDPKPDARKRAHIIRAALAVALASHLEQDFAVT